MRIDSSSIASAALDPTLRAARADAAKAARAAQKGDQATTAASVEAGDNVRSKPVGPDGRPGFAHGIQKKIDAGQYVPAALNSRVGAALAQAGITAPSEAPDDVATPETPEDSKAGALYTTADVEMLNSAYRTSTGEEGFLAEYDFNADGTIDGTDLAQLLANLGQLKPEGEESALDGAYTNADIEGLKQQWGVVETDSRAATRYDFNADGKIDGEDLASLLSRLNSDDELTTGGPLEEAPIAKDDPTALESPDDAIASDVAVPTVSFEEAIEGVDIGLLSDTLASDPAEPTRADLLAQLRSQLTGLINTGTADSTQPSLLELLTRLTTD